MELNLVGTLELLKTMNLVPNFSELSRCFKKDRHTIKKMYEGKEKKIRSKKPSELDDLKDEIINVLSTPGVRIKAAYWFFKNEKSIKCTYDNFKFYVRKNKLLEEARKGLAHPLYETDPGQQLQVDWVESIKLAKTDGEIMEFNLFSATLGYSRYHYFEYTEFKTEADFKRCLVHFFKKIGGITKEVLTDNMAAIVNINGNEKTVHPSVTQFFKDLNVKLRLCKIKSPQTKGKDESSNRFAQWLKAYNGKIEDLGHLLRLIDKLNQDINTQTNTGTYCPPVLLFSKEKEYLSPLPNKEILDFYEDEMRSCKVPSTFVINYKGAKYSVPPNFINKTVKIKEGNDKLYIFYGGELICEHTLNKHNTVNYQEDHYKLGLSQQIGNTDDIDEITSKNLAKFKDLGEK